MYLGVSSWAKKHDSSKPVADKITKNLKIVFISTLDNSQWGGSEILWSQAALRLVKSGHQVWASVPRWPDLPQAHKDLADAGVYLLPRERKSSVLRRVMRLCSLFLKSINPVNLHWKSITRTKPDLICINHSGIICGYPWMLLCQKAGIPYVCLSQANTENWWAESEGLDSLSGAFRSARKCWFVSQANLQLFEKQIGSRLENSEVVRNPFGVTWDAAPKWPNSEEIINFACVGRLEPPAKGQDILFEVLAMEKWRKRPVHLSLYGKGNNEAALRSLAEGYGLADRISFEGHVSSIEEIWTRNHALILPSRYEGLPLALVEAMLCNRVSVVTDVSGNGELLDENVTGFLAEAATARHLDEAMEQAWQRRGEWQEMGRKAGISIRRSIPEDPPAVFANKLIDATISR